MSDLQYEMLIEDLERVARLCDTREKATAQLQSEGLLDESGQTAAMYRAESLA